MRNLRIEELFAGAWVRRWVDVPMVLSSPMFVYALFGDGGLYLDVDGNDGDPFEAMIDEVCPITMDEDSLRGFGFVRVPRGDNVWMMSVGDIRLTISLRQIHGHQQCRRAAISGRFACWNEEIRYIHELQSWWRDRVLLPYGVELPLKWNGNCKEEEEIG